MSSDSCLSCGLPIPQGQGNYCSMCCGDIDHGSDGYYRDWAEASDRAAEDRRGEEEAQIQDELERQQREEDE